MMRSWPATLDAWEGLECRDESSIRVERSLIDQWLEAVRDANPLYWNEGVADEVANGIIAPPSMLSTWMLARRWSPQRPDEFWDAHAEVPVASINRMPIEGHFALKDFLGLKQGIVSGVEQEFHEPVRPGDNLHVVSKIKGIGEERTNRLGTGRPWTVEVSYFNQREQLVAIEHYRFFSYNRKQ